MYRTAAIVIIGNEIISGRTQDLNAKFLASSLCELGIKTLEISIIPDVKQVIVDKVRELSAKYDYVFTTGGIGPTHDDITTEAVSTAVGIALELNERAKQLLEQYYTNHSATDLIKEVCLKMAYLPKGAILINNPISAAPGFQVSNIYVLPGIPYIMQAMFKELIPLLQKGKPIKSRSLEVMVGESIIAQEFTRLQNAYPAIEMGSYPFKKDEKYATTLVLTSTDEIMLDKAFTDLKNLINQMGFSSMVV